MLGAERDFDKMKFSLVVSTIVAALSSSTLGQSQIPMTPSARRAVLQASLFLVAMAAPSAASRARTPKAGKSKQGKAGPLAVVDYLVIGAGAGGLNAAMDLGESLAALGRMRDDAVLLLEASGRVGGRHEQVDVVAPTGYAGPPLRMGVGGMRTNPSTLPLLRRMVEEHGVPSHCSAFRNHIFARGREALCPAPPETGCAIFTDFCSNDAVFVDKTQTDKIPYGAAFNLEGVASDNEDPEDAALQYMIGYSDTNPATGEQCNNDDPDPAKKCPSEACKHYADYRSFLQGILGLEYAEFISLSNVGFLGDQGNAINACRYIDWFEREYDTTSINCYPEGGLQAVDEKMLSRALAAGVHIAYNEPAVAIDGTSGGPNEFRVQTPRRTIYVRKFLFVAINAHDIRGGKVGGDFVAALEARKEFRQPKPAAVATVAVQWDPDSPAWYLDAMDKADGSYTYRQWGDLDCFARAEFIDTPYMRQQNTIRAVYSDYRCLDLWRELIEAADAGDPAPLRRRVLAGLRRSFPGRTVPDPVLVRGKLWEAAWYFSDPLNDATVEELATFAAAPVDGAPACLVGDSYASKFNAWTEGAFSSAKRCLADRFVAEDGSEYDPDLAAELQRRQDARDALIAPFDFGNPGTAGFEIGAYEHFAPFGCLYNEDGSLKLEYTSGANCGPPQCEP